MAEEEKQRREEERTRAEEMAIAEREVAENMEREATEETEGVAEATEEKEPEGLKLVFPPLPTHSWVPPTEVPSERIGTGANTKVHFTNIFNVGTIKTAKFFYRKKR